jgi:hypothetical protein
MSELFEYDDDDEDGFFDDGAAQAAVEVAARHSLQEVTTAQTAADVYRMVPIAGSLFVMRAGEERWKGAYAATQRATIQTVKSQYGPGHYILEQSTPSGPLRIEFQIEPDRPASREEPSAPREMPDNRKPHLDSDEVERLRESVRLEEARRASRQLEAERRRWEEERGELMEAEARQKSRARSLQDELDAAERRVTEERRRVLDAEARANEAERRAATDEAKVTRRHMAREQELRAEVMELKSQLMTTETLLEIAKRGDGDAPPKTLADRIGTILEHAAGSIDVGSLALGFLQSQAAKGEGQYDDTLAQIQQLQAGTSPALPPAPAAPRELPPSAPVGGELPPARAPLDPSTLPATGDGQAHAEPPVVTMDPPEPPVSDTPAPAAPTAAAHPFELADLVLASIRGDDGALSPDAVAEAARASSFDAEDWRAIAQHVLHDVLEAQPDAALAARYLAPIVAQAGGTAAVKILAGPTAIARSVIVTLLDLSVPEGSDAYATELVGALKTALA